ncbi:MAG: dephospho-CoA kinase [Eubacterium sp.]|nr:dephospho-CoA kinase [Eubacterium sp.]
MKIIGITGGVGCGKSEVLNFIEKNYDAAVVRADEVGRDLMRPGTDCTRQIIDLFGARAADADGNLDRAWIADQIFHNPDQRESLNAIVHPAVQREICRLIEQNRACGWQYFFLESAILIEAGYTEICDEIWYIYADVQTRIARLQAGRGYTQAKSLAVMENQLSEETFREACDAVIDNSGIFEDTMEQIDARMTELAAQ